MVGKFIDTGNSSPTPYGYKGGGGGPQTTPPNVNPQGVDPACASISYTPTMEFIPFNGQPYNELVKLGRPVRHLYFRSNQGILDIAAWIHWQKFPVITKDMDTLEALNLPGLFVGSDPVFTVADATAPAAPVQGSYGGGLIARMPFIKLCRPVDNFLFTMWGEDPAAGVTNAQMMIIATDDFEDIYNAFPGGI